MSYLHFNRLVVTGNADAIQALEDAFRKHSEAVAQDRKRGQLSKAFGQCLFATKEMIDERDEEGICNLIEQSEMEDKTAVIRPFPEVLRIHFITNWLMCHGEVKRLARKFPTLRFRLDWMSTEENTTGRLIAIGKEIECEAVIPMWLESLYVLPGDELAGHWNGFHDLGDISMFQMPRGEPYDSMAAEAVRRQRRGAERAKQSR